MMTDGAITSVMVEGEKDPFYLLSEDTVLLTAGNNTTERGKVRRDPRQARPVPVCHYLLTRLIGTVVSCIMALASFSKVGLLLAELDCGRDSLAEGYTLNISVPL
jgi:hypothetical protein